MLTKQDKSYIAQEFIRFEERFEKKIDEKFDAFAIMIQKGFEECATKTELKAVEDRLSIRLDNVEEKLDKVEERLDGVEERLGNVENKLSDIDDRLTSIEHKNFHAPNRRLDKVEDDIRIIKTKVGLL
jgi:chromosome segregation ATPase